MSKGVFPRPLPLGEGSVGWIEDEVVAWLDRLVMSGKALFRPTTAFSRGASMLPVRVYLKVSVVMG